MPACFTLEMMFTRERFKPGFVKDIYLHFIDTGFDFIGGFRWEIPKIRWGIPRGINIETTLEEISIFKR